MSCFKKRLLAFIMLLCLVLPLFSLKQALAEVTFTGIDTLMIYNPLIYNDRWVLINNSWVNIVTDNKLATGNMTGQIKTSGGSFRAKEMEAETPYNVISPLSMQQVRELTQGRYLGPVNESNKPLGEVRAVGDTNQFWIQPNLTNPNSYAKTTMTCRAMGEFCNVWGTSGFANAAIASKIADEFDKKIYANDVAYFGSARFAEDGDKVNILIYPISYPGFPGGVSGYFQSADLYTAEELGENASQYNTGSAILHMNSYYCTQAYLSVAFFTVAHEFQHLICFTSTLKNSANVNRDEMGVWLNEAMAMEAEELNYEGGVEGQGYLSINYNTSTSIARGQSLYSFDTSEDVGAYGHSFLFSEYIKAQYKSERVFSRLHANWRSCTADKLNDAANIMTAMGRTPAAAMLESISYDEDIVSAINETDSILDDTADSPSVFLSKLNLNMQIATVLQEESGLYCIGSACKAANPKLNTSTSVLIQGGGRIFVRVLDGNSYTVPSGADSKLIYVGFKDGKMVFGPTTAADYAPASPTPTATPTPTPTSTPTPAATTTPTATTAPSPTPCVLALYGDANCDGFITAADASSVLRTVVKLAELSEQGRINADVSGDEVVDSLDASLILRKIVLLIDSFPINGQQGQAAVEMVSQRDKMRIDIRTIFKGDYLR